MPWEDDYRSALQELIDTLLYAIVTGTIAVLSLATIAVAFLGREGDLRLLIAADPDAFGPERRVEGFTWLLAYLGLALTAAEVVGNRQILLSARVILATLMFPATNWTRSTVWAWAIEQNARPASPHLRVAALVELNSGERYQGVLSQYPIIADDKAKDFVLAEPAVYDPVTLRFGAPRPEALLLLNSRDVRTMAVGPLRRPPSDPEPQERGGYLVETVPWVFLVAIAALALRELLTRPDQDLLIRLLEAFCVQVVAWPVSEFLRGQVIGGVAVSKLTQRLWVLTEVSTVIGFTLLVTAFAPLLAFGLLATAAVGIATLLWRSQFVRHGRGS